MIDVFISKSGQHYTGFRVTGHAGYAEQGKDIVCAAVSALTITLHNSLVELSDATMMEKKFINQETPWVFTPCPNDKTDLLIGQYRIGIEGVQEAFPDYVKLHLET
ncbi:ribosomal-processing cysteine protease Prp [Lachnospiraceae bacterium 50-23]